MTNRQMVSKTASTPALVNGRWSLQRKCACGGAAGLGGQCANCDATNLLLVQPRLSVGEPDDAFEREADRVAQQVVSGRSGHAGEIAPLAIRSYSPQPTQVTGAPPASLDAALASAGRPLGPAVRQDMERRFGHDFSRVRVHIGSEADRSTRDLSAHAYTLGRDIVFGQGRFAPETMTGRHLLAHELTHVVQQSRSTHRPWSGRRGRAPADATGSPTAHPPAGARPRSGHRAGRPDERLASGREEPGRRGTDAFDNIPESVVLHGTKAIPAYNSKMFDAGYKTYFGLVTNMKVGPKSSYEACITEVLKVEENTCGDQGNVANYKPCTPKKHCMKVGEACGGDVLDRHEVPVFRHDLRRPPSDDAEREPARGVRQARVQGEMSATIRLWRKGNRAFLRDEKLQGGRVRGW